MVDYAQLDHLITSWVEDIDILDYVEDPYKSTDYDVAGVDAGLRAKKEELAQERESADDETEQALLDLYEKTVDRLYQYNRIIMHRSNEDIVRDATRAVYGSPDPEYVAQAKEILNTFPAIEDTDAEMEERTLDVYDMQEAMEAYFDLTGMTGWTAEIDEDKEINFENVHQASRTVRIPHPEKNITYGPKELRAYRDHEGQHGRRGANGEEQQYNIFRIGVGRYNATDEGLSSLFELAAATPEHQISRLRTFALRTLSSDSVLNRDHSYDETVNYLEQYADPDTAESVASRAHRAGGFAKDWIYQQGLHEVSEYLSDAHDVQDAFDTLYVGKFGMDDLDAVEHLLDAGELKKPSHTPLPAIQETGVDARTAANVIGPLTG